MSTQARILQTKLLMPELGLNRMEILTPHCTGMAGYILSSYHINTKDYDDRRLGERSSHSAAILFKVEYAVL